MMIKFKIIVYFSKIKILLLRLCRSSGILLRATQQLKKMKHRFVMVKIALCNVKNYHFTFIKYNIGQMIFIIIESLFFICFSDRRLPLLKDDTTSQ